MGIQCGTRQVGAAPVTVLPTSIAGPISRWGRGPTMSRVLPRGALSTHGRDPGPPPRGVRDFHALLDLQVCTPALRPGDPGPPHAITTAGTLQDERRKPHRTKDEIQDDSDARRLPTVHFLQCSTTVPRDSRENDDFRAPTLMYTASPYNYKRRGWASFCKGGRISPIEGWKQAP